MTLMRHPVAVQSDDACLELEVAEELLLGSVVHEGGAEGLQVDLVPQGPHNLPEERPQRAQVAVLLHEQLQEDDGQTAPRKVARWQILIPSFPWIVPGWRAWGCNPGKGWDQILQRSVAEP